jgi:hypothetical protein
LTVDSLYQFIPITAIFRLFAARGGHRVVRNRTGRGRDLETAHAFGDMLLFHVHVRIIERRFACPKIAISLGSSTPRSIARVANVCRRSYITIDMPAFLMTVPHNR